MFLSPRFAATTDTCLPHSGSGLEQAVAPHLISWVALVEIDRLKLYRRWSVACTCRYQTVWERVSDPDCFSCKAGTRSMRHHLRLRLNRRSAFKIWALAALTLASAISVAFAQASGGGGSAGAGGGGAAAGRSGSATPGGAPHPTIPVQPAPGVQTTPTDPGRNNVDANPPTRRLEGAGPGSTRAPTAAPTPRNDQPGSTQTAPQGAATGRPGAATSANSDGYSECMAMWQPSSTGMSREEWSKTCDRTRLPPKQ
jgi:hypothetical protein